MKQSKYNYLLKLENGTTLFFNFYTLKLLALNPVDTKKATNFLHKPENIADSSIKELLLENGFLIKTEINELELLKRDYFLARVSTKNLQLTIAPTLNCNFACPYCYQGTAQNSMDDNTVQSVFNFVEKRLPDKGALHITWFGGEPLIQWKQIKNLSTQIQKICSGKNADYSASIISNGFLLESEIVDDFEKHKIIDIQITLDGPPEIHNSRRILKNGSATFNRIIENIKMAANSVHINVRMNIDNTNATGISEVLHILKKENLYNKVGFYLGHVLPYTDVCSNISDSCLSNKQYAALGVETLLKMAKLGFTSSFTYPKAFSNFCMADRVNAFVISPNGDVTKCWNCIGNINEQIGNINNPEQKSRYKWIVQNPFDEECKDCKVLPICMGGCPYLKNRTGKRDCSNWKYYTDEYLLYYYYLKNRETETEILSRIDKARKVYRKMI